MKDKQRKDEWKALHERIEKLEGVVPNKDVLFSDVREIAEETERLLNCTETTPDTVAAWKKIEKLNRHISSLVAEYRLDGWCWRTADARDMNNLKFYIHMMWDDDHAKLPNEVPDDEYTWEKYPKLDPNAPKSVQQKAEDDRFFFFQSYFERHKPELEHAFTLYIHDMNSRRSFCGHVAGDFDVEDIKEAWKQGKITGEDAAFIFWQILEWIHYELLHSKPKDDEYIAELFRSWQRNSMACKILVNGDIYPFDEKDDELYGKNYEQDVRGLVKSLQAKANKKC